jgi:hypothetical protein
MSPAHVLALQRSAGNAAVGRLLRERAPQKDELLSLTLRWAALRAHEARQGLKDVKRKDGRDRFAAITDELVVQLDEALLQAPQAGRAAFKDADALFESAIALVKLAQERKWSGAKRLEEKLSALNKRLQEHGYKFPLEKVTDAKLATPPEPSSRDLARATRLGVGAARTALEAGLKRLAEERKQGGDPRVLHGSPESVTYLRAARAHIENAGALHDDDRRAVLTDIMGLGRIVLGALRQDGRLDGAKALWDEVNALNQRIGLDPLMPFGTPTATSRHEASVERLEALDKQRREAAESGVQWTPDQSKAQVGAEHEAIAAANEALGKAKAGTDGAQQLDVADVMQRVTSDIDRIEISRSVGYTDAVTYLASTALDTPSNIRSFVQSLIGNLVWALSSFIPPVGLLARSVRFGKALGDVQRADALLAAATGVVGAMVAQFSAGLPSGGSGDVSGHLDRLKAGLKSANAQLCDHRRATAFIALSKLMDRVPPRPDEDRAAYLAGLETALRHLLFGEIFEKGLNNGPRPQGAKVEAEARRQMLTAAAAPLAGVDESGKLETTTPVLDMDYAEKILKAVEQDASIKFEPWDLVTSRIPIAAREMGVEVTFDPAAVTAALAKGAPVELAVSGFEWRRAGLARPSESPTFSRWHALHRDDRVWTIPEFTLSKELDAQSIRHISSLSIIPPYVEKRTFHGKEVYMLERVAFSATGGERFSGMFRGSKPPDAFKMIYSFSEA